MSMSTEYIIDRIDEATRVNRDAKQVCNDALSLARGRIRSLQRDIEWQDAMIKAKVEEIKKKDAIIKDLEEQVQALMNYAGDLYSKSGSAENSSGQGTDGCEILQDASGNLTIKCSSGSGEDRWIPCSERMPYNFVDVLVQIEYDDKRPTDIRVGYHSMEHKGWYIGYLYGSHDLILGGSVIAWQPLPEKYKEPVEDAKFEIGDFVLCVSKHGVKMNAIYLKEGEECYQVLEKESQRIQPLDKNYWKLTKYPGHISVVDWLNGLPES